VRIEDLVQNLQFAHPLPRLIINSKPSQARVSIDGQYVGQTPFGPKSIGLGQHQIEVSRNYAVDLGSYQPSKKQTITVEDGEDRSIDVDLPRPANLKVISDPTGLAVRINDKDLGPTPLTLTLPPDSYQVELSGIKGLENQPQRKTVVLDVAEDDLVEFKVNYDRSKFKIENQELISLHKVMDNVMVLIPAGPDTKSFYMDRYEVTNSQYREFVEATGHEKPRYWDWDEYRGTNKPVVGVSWEDATAYAKWAGKRLPTQKEFEWAARGRLISKRFPWGSDAKLARDYANYSGIGGKDIWSKTTLVGSLRPNGYGLFDVIGNVWEWCDDQLHDHKIVCGGSWSTPLSNLPGYNYTYHPNSRVPNVGFRCVSGSN